MKDHEDALAAGADALSAQTSKNADLENSLQRAKEHLKFFEDRSKQLQDANDELKLKNDQLATEASQHDAKLKERDQSLEEQRALHSRQTADWESAMGSLRQENSNLHSDYKKACELADRKAAEVTDLLDKLERSEQDVEKLRERLSKTEADLDLAKTAEQ